MPLREMGKGKKHIDTSFVSSDELLEVSGTIIIALNRDGTVILANRKASEILGYSKEKIIGKEWFGNFLPKKSWKTVREVFEKMMAGEIEPQEYYVNPVLNREGEERNIFWHNTVLKNDEGKIIGTLSSGEDITDREKIEVMLQESEEKYRALFDRSTEGILIADVETRDFIFANPALCKLLGYTEEEFKKLNVSDLHPKESLDHVISEFDAQGRGEKVIAYMIPCLRKDGELVYANISTTPLYIGGRKCNTGFFTDMTEKKRITELMEESEKKYRTIFNSVNVGLVISDIQGRFLDVNPCFCRMYGYSREEAIGLHASQVIRPDYHDQFAEFVESIRTAGYFHGETIDLRKDGTEINVEVSGSMISIGEKKYMLAILTDITRRKRTEGELKERENLYRSLVETSPTAISTVDLEGNILFVNEFLAKMHGYRDSEILMRKVKNIAELVDPRSQGQLKQEIQHVIENGISELKEYNLMKKDGTPFIAEVVATRIVGDNNVPVGIMAVAIDRTDHSMIAEQLRQAQKMEAVGLLAGGIAHDFNNLLQIIRGYTDLSLQGLNLGHPVREFLEEIEKAENRGEKLVNQLLTFSRKQVMKPQNINLNVVIADLLKMLKRIIGEHIHLRFSPAEELMDTYVDRGMMELVLMNLCVNARDAMPAGGNLDIRTENMSIDSEFCKKQTWAEPGEYNLLTVTDNGCGISPESIQHIFEPFFSTKELGKGTGLGLSTVYGIIKQHRGMIQVSSEPEKGTVFRIYIPAVETPDEDSVESMPGEVFGGGETILYAEDNDVVRDLTGRNLKDAGYNVIMAVDGKDAVALFREHKDKIDALMFDIVMPKMSGYEAYKEILLISPGIPVLFMSGYSENVIHTDFAMDEKLKIIRKPYSRDNLLRAIRKMIDGAKGDSSLDDNLDDIG